GIQTDFFPAPLRSFQPFGSELIANGLQVAVGDLTGDRRDDVVVAGETQQGPRIKGYAGANRGACAPLKPVRTVAGASLRVAVGDVDGDGRVDVVAAGDTNAGPSVRAFSSAGAPLFSLPGIGLQESIAVGDVDGDGRGDIVISSGPGFDPRVVV